MGEVIQLDQDIKEAKKVKHGNPYWFECIISKGDNTYRQIKTRAGSLSCFSAIGALDAVSKMVKEEWQAELLRVRIWEIDEYGELGELVAQTEEKSDTDKKTPAGSANSSSYSTPVWGPWKIGSRFNPQSFPTLKLE